MAGPSRTFVFSHELLYPVGDFTKKSRFVLYDDGAFALQYEGRFLYRGAYTEVNGVITFEWEGSRAWGATGTLKGDSLTVQYNVNMQLSDFEDAAYALTA